MNKIFIYCWAMLFIMMTGYQAGAGESFVLQGNITDIDGQPVAGAEVSVYKTKNVKKPAAFVSNRTGADGKYKVTVPQGSYWVVALYRKSGKKIGPLELGDKHSGEALELDVGPDEDLALDFSVMDLREAAKKSQKRNELLVKLSWRILDKKGRPVVNAYAMADPLKKFRDMPRYLSAWTDKSGVYSLFLPRGSFFIGVSAGFPPDAAYLIPVEVVIENDRNGFDLVLPEN